ncbi:putative methyltransferase [Sinorhizobium phage phiM12]|uniref:Putative methyltransferase n=1 Tax=Sinorhizobium phage phiM12 TaxID=1357423 RepID=S5M6G6_9CAUD|nr:methyltransferase [Sinorhizobium phage phiM12]AGR47641.2 putative methyltransferase [Sinorhizobium phage phiM12]
MTQIIFKPENVDGFDGFYWDKDDFGAWWGPLNDWDVSHRDFVESIKNRRTVIQAGGNLGLYVCFLSKRFENVITFEPDPDNFAILVKNVEYHGLKNVIAINSALGEETRSAKMRKGPRENVGMHQIDESGDIPVEMIALNDLTTVANLDFLWLDIEQYELPALRGAAKLLEQHKPVVMVENANNAIALFLYGLGYRESRTSKMDTIFEIPA